MSRTLKKSGVIIEEHIVRQEPTNDDPEYSTAANAVFGAIQIFLGFFSIALGISAVCIRASGYFIAYGIWCGFIFIVAGIISIIAGCSKQSCLVTTNLVFGIIASCTAAVQFSLGVVAAANDYQGAKRWDYPDAIWTKGRFDIYYSKIYNKMGLCKGSDKGYGWESWGAVDVLLLLVAFFEGLMAILTAAFSCRSICCGVTNAYQIEDEPPASYLQEGPNGYYNEGFGASGSTMRPLVYSTRS